jgi:hypothetical protein
MAKTKKGFKKGGQGMMGNYNQGQGIMGNQSSSFGSSSLNPFNWSLFNRNKNPNNGSSFSSRGGKKKRGGFRANTQGSLASNAAPVSGMSSPKPSYVGGRKTKRRGGKRTRRH